MLIPIFFFQKYVFTLNLIALNLSSNKPKKFHQRITQLEILSNHGIMRKSSFQSIDMVLAIYEPHFVNSLEKTAQLLLIVSASQPVKHP